MFPGAGNWVGVVTANGYKVRFCHDENVLEVNSTVAQLCGYIENKTVHFKGMNIMVCELHPNFKKSKK